MIGRAPVLRIVLRRSTASRLPAEVRKMKRLDGEEAAFAYDWLRKAEVLRERF